MAYVWFMVVSLIWGGSFILMKKAAVVFEPLTIGAGRVLGGAVVLAVLLGLGVARKRSAAAKGAKPRSSSCDAATSASRLARMLPGGGPGTLPGTIPGTLVKTVSEKRSNVLPGVIPGSISGKLSGFGALLVLVALGFVYPFSMQPYLIGKLGQSGFIGMMVALVPLLTIAAGAVMLGTWPARRQWAGVLLGLVCMPVLFGVGRDLGVSVGDLALAATVPLGYAISNTWVKRRLNHWSPMMMTAAGCGLAALVLVPAGVWESTDTSGMSGVAGQRWWPSTDSGFAGAWAQLEGGASALLWPAGAVMLLGMVGTGVATVLFYRLIQERGPLFAGMVTYVVPAEALLWGAMDGETVTRWQIVALGVIFLSVALVQWPASAKSNKPAALEHDGNKNDNSVA